jgi:hypothetical protein
MARYQSRFAEAYAKYLNKRIADQKKAEAACIPPRITSASP